MRPCVKSHQQLRSYGNEPRLRVSSDRVGELEIELGATCSDLSTTTRQLLAQLCINVSQSNILPGARMKLIDLLVLNL